MKPKQWNRRANTRGAVKIRSHEPDVHYITLEQWFDNLDKVGTAVLLPETKEFVQRMWWMANFAKNKKLRGKLEAGR